MERCPNRDMPSLLTYCFCRRGTSAGRNEDTRHMGPYIDSGHQHRGGYRKNRDVGFERDRKGKEGCELSSEGDRPSPPCSAFRVTHPGEALMVLKQWLDLFAVLALACKWRMAYKTQSHPSHNLPIPESLSLPFSVRVADALAHVVSARQRLFAGRFAGPRWRSTRNHGALASTAAGLLARFVTGGTWALGQDRGRRLGLGPGSG